MLPDGRTPVLLTAHDAGLIGCDAAAIRDYLHRHPDADVAGVAATVLATRRVRRHRALVRAADRDELLSGLTALTRGDEHPLVARRSAPGGPATPRIAFVFPGQGGQWPAMGAEAYRLLPAYRAEVDRCGQAFTAAGHPSPLPYLLADAGESSQLLIQGAQFIHAVAWAQVWRSCGIAPDLTVGHSLGEVAAAYVAGAIALPDAVAVVAARAHAVAAIPGRHGMAVLGTGTGHAEQLIAETPGWLEISSVNTACSVVVSGDDDAVAAIVRLAGQHGIFAKKIAVDYPGHTSALKPVCHELERSLPAVEFTASPVPFVGSCTGDIVPAGTRFRSYWPQNLCNTVRFDRAVGTATRCGADVFVELSAHPALLGALNELVDDGVIVGSGRRDEPVTEHLAAGIAAVAVTDPERAWAGRCSSPNSPLLSGFPNAPMRGVHLWADRLPPARVTAAPTVMSQEWEAVTPAPETGGSMAIIGTGLPLERQLAAAAGCRNTAADDAEVIVFIAPALTDPDPVTAGELIAGLPAGGLPDYDAVVGPRCRRIWLLTAGGEQVGSTDAVALPAQATLAAMHRCAGFEYPDRDFGHLDLPAWDIGAETACSAVEVLIGDTAEAAVRDGRCYTRVVREAHRPQQPLPVMDDVVITGGNGTIGLHFARYCIDHGARRVILLSRNGVGSGALHELAAGSDVELHAPICDVTDPDAVRAVAAEYSGSGASLLIHAAGTARFGPHHQLTRTDLSQMFGAKVTGLARMIDGWPLRDDSRILLCSSVSGVWGGHGHAGYAAANRLLDVAAARLRSQGYDASAVRWGLWQGSTIADGAEIARIQRSGLVAMHPDAAVDTGLRTQHNDPMILRADPHRLRIIHENRSRAQDRETRPDNLPVDEMIRAELAGTLRIDDPRAVDLNAALTDLGVDSLLALDLRKRLLQSTGRKVTLAQLLAGITGVELIGVVLGEPA